MTNLLADMCHQSDESTTDDANCAMFEKIVGGKGSNAVCASGQSGDDAAVIGSSGGYTGVHTVESTDVNGTNNDPAFTKGEICTRSNTSYVGNQIESSESGLMTVFEESDVPIVKPIESVSKVDAAITLGLSFCGAEVDHHVKTMDTVENVGVKASSDILGVLSEVVSKLETKFESAKFNSIETNGSSSMSPIIDDADESCVVSVLDVCPLDTFRAAALTGVVGLAGPYNGCVPCVKMFDTFVANVMGLGDLITVGPVYVTVVGVDDEMASCIVNIRGKSNVTDFTIGYSATDCRDEAHNGAAAIESQEPGRWFWYCPSVFADDKRSSTTLGCDVDIAAPNFDSISAEMHAGGNSPGNVPVEQVVR